MLQTIKNLPHSPGIYQFFDKNDRLLYVGKAKDLSNRVKSYFYFTPTLRANPNLSHRIGIMIQQAKSLNYIVVKSEHDALILENSLIKQLNPKYNILLRDDKTYPYIYIDYSKEYPRFELTRKIIKNKNIKYFGPYSSGARDILNAIYSHAKLVQKKANPKGKKLCLYYQLGSCLGVCQKEISKATYQKEIDKALKLIQNKNVLLEFLKNKMLFYAKELRFEEAQELRDAILRIEKSQISSDIDLLNNENYDIFTIYQDNKKAVLLKIFIRDGKIISSSHSFINADDFFDKDEAYKQAILDFYKQKPPIIANILTGDEFESMELLQEHLSKLFEKNISIKNPKRGKKRQLIELSFINAKELVSKHHKKDDTTDELKDFFALSHTPYRIEAFDNSHMAGVGCVGGMIVYENGEFQKKDYKMYHLHAKDEYAQMKEMLSRRIKSFEKNSPPDLWVIDGGSTILKLAKELLDSSGVCVDLIAISKEKADKKTRRAKGLAKDIIFTCTEKFTLPTYDKKLQFIQKLRDETHRFAINFHKKTKLKLDNESKLLKLNGISQAKIKKLLDYFGTFEMIKKASFDELSAVLNKKDANIIKKFYT